MRAKYESLLIKLFEIYKDITRSKIVLKMILVILMILN